MSKRQPKLIVNLTRGSAVCERGLIADSPFTRMRGLLGQRSLASEVGLLLRPAWSIHTAFMHFPIDAVFLNDDMQILRFVSLKPWRAASVRGAHSVLELAHGECARRDVRVGDRLAVLEHETGLQSRDSNGTRVLLVSADRRFRSVASALLTRRGCAITVRDGADDVTEIATREGTEVVVIDATSSLTKAAHEAAGLQRLRPRVGVVTVSAEPKHRLAALPVLEKWGSFDALLAAIETARRSPTREGATHAQR